MIKAKLLDPAVPASELRVQIEVPLWFAAMLGAWTYRYVSSPIVVPEICEFSDVVSAVVNKVKPFGFGNLPGLTKIGHHDTVDSEAFRDGVRKLLDA